MKKFRVYFDKDLEEEWLKEMSSQGWGFKKFFLCVYTFEQCKPNEYNYQIDLLENWDGDRENFSSFMEEAGVEVISQWYRWVYLRKKAVDGPFEMYTDAQSKIAQYSRIQRFFMIAMFIEIICFIIEFNALLETGMFLIGAFTVLIGIIIGVFLRMVLKCGRKINQLQKQIQ